MVVRFDCPRGHRIKADQRHGGKSAHCPACGEPVAVPSAFSRPITESGALRVLNECESEVVERRPRKVRVSIPMKETTRECPRCLG